MLRSQIQLDPWHLHTPDRRTGTLTAAAGLFWKAFAFREFSIGLGGRKRGSAMPSASLVSRVLRRLVVLRLYAAGSHPALKCLVRFECGRNSVMRANDRADGLPWEFGSGVDQGDDVHLLAL